MVMDIYESLLEEFSKAAHIPNLKPDANNTCLLGLPNGVKVQIELDSAQTAIIIGSGVGFLPAGRYRETVFKEALKANNLPHPRYGDFAFSKKTDNLILFMKLPLQNLTGDKIAALFAPFSEKAARWKDSIDKGEIPSLYEELGSRKGGRGCLGFKPDPYPPV